MFRGLHIGIDRYADARVQWLSSAVRDADALHALFADTFGVEGQLLADETATAAAIRNGLSALATAAADDDIVVIPYAGHGSEDHFLIPHDADVSRMAETCISLDELADLITTIPGQMLFCALDCCFSGGLGARVFATGLRPRSAAGGSSVAALNRFTGDARVVLTAAADDQPALESVRHGHGLLTFRLMEALADRPSASGVRSPSRVFQSFEMCLRERPSFARLTHSGPGGRGAVTPPPPVARLVPAPKAPGSGPDTGSWPTTWSRSGR